jgi:hypothetical protein
MQPAEIYQKLHKIIAILKGKAKRTCQQAFSLLLCRPLPKTKIIQSNEDWCMHQSEPVTLYLALALKERFEEGTSSGSYNSTWW